MKVTVKLAQEINILYDAGNTMKTIAEMFDLCSSTVCKYVWNPRGFGPVKK